MDELLQLTERPQVQELYLIAGWRQWADAGSVSSALPPYLVEQTRARKIGEFQSESFYVFQLPGMHHYFRPEIKLVDGYRSRLDKPRNEIYFTGDDQRGFVIFIGDEPHLSIDRYAELFFNLARELGVRRIVTVGGVYAPVPYDKDRDVSCTFSLPRLKEEMTGYAVRFSNYEGGVSIGSYLAERAEELGMEYIVLYAMVPMYDFSELSPLLQGMTVGHDWKAWYDIMRRLNHMFKLGIDLADLQGRSQELMKSVAQQIKDLEAKVPQLGVRDYLEKLTEDFTETSFEPLDDVWEKGLGDLLQDLDE